MTTSKAGTRIAKLIATDPAVTNYQLEGSFGYLHHENRTAAADETLQLLCGALDYTAAEFAGLLISKMGRWAGDYLPEAGKPITDRHIEALRSFLAGTSTRRWCAASHRDELAR